jgi:glyceraldehyde 3-phosphate dehydrogenase
MKARVAINGFGRIGRLFLRVALEKSRHFEVVAVNDLVPADNLAYLLKYDTVHRRPTFPVYAKGESIFANQKEIRVLSEKDPTKMPYKELGVDYVVESTGYFTRSEDAEKHLQAGVKRVVISAPAKDEAVRTFVYGVNHRNFDPKTDRILSNASCTTNCLAPLTKILVDHFGIEEGLMTTVHAMTSSQPSVDGPSKKDWRGGRAASANIIPSTTGAAKAVSLCIPEVKGKLTGMAFRVPTMDVSVVDLTVRLSRSTSYEELCQAIIRASENEMKDIVQFCDEELVSSDFIGNHHACIFDKRAGIALNDRFFKLVAWYDNEMGYSNTLVNLIDYIASKE